MENLNNEKITPRLKGHQWLFGAVAHRGLHDENLPENGLKAFAAAVEKGYPIETDVQLTKDGELVCFHDDSLERMTGKKAYVCDLTLDEIKKLRLGSSDEQVPAFKEFLNLVNGVVPLLIEIKKPVRPNDVAEKTVAALKGYNGKFVIQSFDPRVLKKVRLANENIVRGHLISCYRGGQPFLQYFALKHGFFNGMAKPDFLNVSFDGLPFKNKRPVLCWTIRSVADEDIALKYADGYVFENIVPRKK